MSEHTPGPWYVGDPDMHGQPMIYSEDGPALIAVVCHECVRPDSELDANARLIAKAPLLPKLAEALRELLMHIRGEHEGMVFCRQCGEWDDEHSLDCPYNDARAILAEYDEALEEKG